MTRARCKMEIAPLNVLNAFSLFEPYLSNSFHVYVNHVYVTLTIWSGASRRTRSRPRSSKA
jgi:hypothetical protein